MEKGLSAKRKRFCLEYAIESNATKAAIAAGYPEKSAGSQGYDLLKIPEIIEEIERVRNKIIGPKIVRRLKYEHELEGIAFARVDDFLEQKGNVLILKDMKKIPPNKLAAVQSVSQVSNSYGVKTTIKFYDKTKALEQYANLHELVQKQSEKDQKSAANEEQNVEAKLTPSEYLKILKERNAVQKAD